MTQHGFIAKEVEDKLRAEVEEIERSAMLDQPGWRERLDRASDQNRRAALQILLRPPTFERWCVLTEALAPIAVNAFGSPAATTGTPRAAC